MTPPSSVRSMQVLDKAAFAKKITVPCFKIKTTQLNVIRKTLKPYLLKLEKFNPVSEDPEDAACKLVLLNPDLIRSMDDLKEQDRKHVLEAGLQMSTTDVDVGYDNWRSDLILRSVLPSEEDGSKGYSVIGHIVHLNLREHLLPYKNLIGQVLLDKLRNVRTVVNKVDAIDNTYRNFQMEVLVGDPDLVTTVRENDSEFKLDFGLVYWNSRLSTEHDRIVQMINKSDVVYDVFAGVGPFTVPAARKGARVLSNDLNPESFKWLQQNVKLNKVEKKGGSATCFNKDGRAFILEDVKKDLEQLLSGDKPIPKVHFVMNLPAIATTFLDALDGLLPASFAEADFKVLVHVYCFARDFEPEKLAQQLVEKDLGFEIGDDLIELKLVRKVSPSNHMARLSFNYKLSRLCKGDVDEPVKKKLCLE
jgi:tRNA (guanine37-N1)-methyltransferase